MNPKLIPIKYNNREYPKGIKSKIIEVPAHFDCKLITGLTQPCSLHTEYSYGERKWSSTALNGLYTIQGFHLKNIPQLWKDTQWASEFADFIENITKEISDKSFIKIIEIHPPFYDYCATVHDFIEVYKNFEKKISQKFPEVEIFLENRNGSRYPGKFLISNVDNLIELASEIKKNNLRLKLVIDFPQLLSAYKPRKDITKQDISDIILPLKKIKDTIRGIHIWGAKGSLQHHGDLNDLFNNRPEIKEHFLNELKNLLSDGIERYFIPEVNSNDRDLLSIIEDFENSGFIFNYHSQD